jgi:hypothetical protein
LPHERRNPGSDYRPFLVSSQRSAAGSWHSKKVLGGMFLTAAAVTRQQRQATEPA